MNGISDTPIETLDGDRFGLQKYIEGLSEFIKECETPMTIAIQGDWGSGKTSMLNMIRRKLGDDVKSIWFNTWQYSKFNMDEKLSLSLLMHLYMALQNDNAESNKKIIAKIATLAKTGIRISSYVMDALGAQKAAEDVGNLVNKDAAEEDAVHVIEDLKKDFQQEIDTIYEKTHKRVVVFIDDLDRLAPSKAVDLMEVLKLFLDCNNCVYVLAIDYDVVTRGISEKYGADFGEKQGKKFFDKIIQVPFFIPVEQYKIDDYLRTSMPSYIKLDKDDMQQYTHMIKYSVGCNPRSMKRLFNAYLLISIINKDKGFENDAVSQKLLFATLCLQLSMEDVYRYLVEQTEDLDETFLAEFLNETGSEKFESYFQGTKLENTDTLNKDNILSFMKEMVSIIAEPSGEIPEEGINKLKDILSISSSTNNVTITAKKGTAVLNEDISIERKIGDTEYKYKIITAGAKFNIGFDENITFCFGNKKYESRMHSKTKGRIDGLTQFFADSGLQAGDDIKLIYNYNEKTVKCEPLK